MFTLADFDQGRLYSRLYKDLYGYRPRDLVWSSPEEFEEDLEKLREELEEVEFGGDEADREWEDDDTVFLNDTLESELGYNPFDDRFEDEWN